jgi:hypothetical protein
VIRVSYLEIYNEQVRDLLDPKKGILDVYLDEKVPSKPRRYKIFL